MAQARAVVVVHFEKFGLFCRRHEKYQQPFVLHVSLGHDALHVGDVLPEILGERLRGPRPGQVHEHGSPCHSGALRNLYICFRSSRRQAERYTAQRPAAGVGILPCGRHGERHFPARAFRGRYVEAVARRGQRPRPGRRYGEGRLGARRIAQYDLVRAAFQCRLFGLVLAAAGKQGQGQQQPERAPDNL